jgi:hypothetical protein
MFVRAVPPITKHDQNRFTDQVDIGCMIKTPQRISLLPRINRRAMFALESRATVFA